MRRYSLQKILRSCVSLWLLVRLSTPAWAGEYEFRVTFPHSVRAAPFTGRVFLFFSKAKEQEPRLGPNWFKPEPILALDVENWQPNEPLAIGAGQDMRLLANPKPLAELDLAGYRVQAVTRFNPYERVIGRGPGNGYSPVVDVAAPAGAAAPQILTIDKLVEEQPFPENQWFKLVSVRSELLSKFHNREVLIRGGVFLPSSYHEQPERRYPVIFEVPGFGGTHISRRPKEPVAEKNAAGVEFLRVTLDPSCPLGHHVFADSANNGPVGQALVSELIPQLDRDFRTVAAPTARFLTGHSSGGWSSLWLQVTYPDVFGGTWSTAPDPVDFRDFQRINLYHPGENMYKDGKGDRRPLARMGDSVALWYDDFDHTEEILGYGGQLHSFEAVFSPRGPDGKPLRAWDRSTGVVHTEVTRTWERYDIRLVLERNWPELGPKLAGKLTVIQGELDTFYLDGATRLLKESLAKLNSDAVVEIVPGKTHFDLVTPELGQRIRAEIVARYLKHHPAR